jgi:paraquat-inducible protein B
MNETMNDPDLGGLPSLRPASRSRFSISWVWVVPAIAVLVGLGLALRAVLERGPEITVQFASAEGLEANKTRLKYKDVPIGTVTSISLSGDRHSVRITAAMDKQAEPLLVRDSRFWVVRPRVGAGGISGLSTLLSGAYIAVDPGTTHEAERSFTGLDVPPLVVSGMAGRQFVLAANDLGSLDVGAPVYFRRLPVGRVVGYGMRPDGKAVDVRIFVDAPYDRFVTGTSRFWHASGIDVSMDADGLKMDVQSVASLVMGGIAFSSLDAETGDGAPAPAEATFDLHADRATALRLPDSVVQKYVLIFNESLRGLTVGAPVDFRGLAAGEVSRIDLDLRRSVGDTAMAVEISLYPERLARRERGRQPGDRSPGAIRRVIDAMVAKGLRGQVRTGNLLTGQRYVALDYFSKAKAARVNWQEAIPELPTQPGSFDSLQDQLQGLVETMQKTLERTDQLMASVDSKLVPELSATLADVRTTLHRADRLLASDAPSQVQLRETLREVGRASVAVRNLAELLGRQPEALLTGRKEIP